MASKIRVKVDDDPKIWKFLIEPEWTKIKHLEGYLKEIFDLHEIFLLDEDGYLHPNSKISYLHCMAKNNEILTIRNSITDTHYSDRNSAKRKKLECEDYNQKKKNTNIISNDIMAVIKSSITEKHKQNLIANKQENAMKDFSPSFLGDFKSKQILNENLIHEKNISIKSNRDLEKYSEDSEPQYEKHKKRRLRKKKSNSHEMLKSPVVENNSVKISNKKIKTKPQNGIKSNLNNPFKNKDLESRHFHFDDSGEPVVESVVPEKKSKIIFINYLESQNCNKPRIIKPTIVHLNDQLSSTKEITQCDNISAEIIEDNANKLNNNDSLSQDNIICPQISAEFLNHKLEKWDTFQDDDENCKSDDKMQLEIHSKLSKNEISKVIIISDEIIANGVN